MKNKQLKKALKRAEYREHIANAEMFHAISSIKKLRDDLTMLQVESDQKSSDIEQLQADFCAEVDELNQVIEAQRVMLGAAFCAEVDELNQVIEAQRVMLGAAQAQMRILLEQNTRLLARGGGWVPIVEAHGLICQCLEGCPATLSVVDGELSLGFEKEVFSFVLPDDMRLCTK